MTGTTPKNARPSSLTTTARFVPGGKTTRAGAAPEEAIGRVPRVSRLMALAIRFDGLVRSGAVTTQAELAAVGHVTRARVTQIMNLLHLAPDLQEAILFLPLVTAGKDPLTEHDLRPIAAEVEWGRQRRLWQTYQTKQGETPVSGTNPR
ncbi:MAG: hypothetical protein AB7K52_15585 [Phycisphaerales bacterium]|jgi:hypothetical protein